MKILILTGAGVSAPSGLSTFRGDGGLWDRENVEQVATPDAFSRNPGRVLDFYNERREQVMKAKPNSAHEALARLQESTSHKVILITQNIDDLHERAGSKRVYHLHGSLMEAKCDACWRTWRSSSPQEPEDICPFCQEAFVRPNVIWFGEAPMHRSLADEAAKKADLFVSIGTSGKVYPAADLLEIATASGTRTIQFNIENTEQSARFDEVRLGNAMESVPLWVESILR
jgi:NAD-dependent deacetylase